MKQNSPKFGIRWVVFLSVGIVVGGTTLALERIFNLTRSTLIDVIVGASILTILVSFLGFVSRYRE